MPEGLKEDFSFEEIKPKEEGIENIEYGKEKIMEEIGKLDVEIAELQILADAQKDQLNKIADLEKRSELENIISENKIKIKGKHNIQDRLRIRAGEMALKKEIKTGKYE